LGVVGLLFGSVGFGYVAVKNQQTGYGKDIEKLETASRELSRKADDINSHITKLLERGRLKDRLARAGSSLRPISVREVIEVPRQFSYADFEAGKEVK
jgi:cell division protein FtsL